MLELNVAKAEDGVFYGFEGEVELPETLLSDRLARFSGATAVKGRFVMTDGDVIVDAKCSTPVVFGCDRCLEEVETELKYNLGVGFALEKKEGFARVYTGNTVTLDDSVAEEFRLALPTRVVCRKDCKGLCPTCGKNLNDGACGCEDKGAQSNPFAALKDAFKD